MKKEYKKPQILFEDLRFSSAIAMCGMVRTNENDCQMIELPSDFGGGFGYPTYDRDLDTVLIVFPGPCETSFYCYHVPYTSWDAHLVGNS